MKEKEPTAGEKRHEPAILANDGRTLWNSSQDTIHDPGTGAAKLPRWNGSEVGLGLRSHQERPRYSAAPHPGFFYLKIHFITGGARGTTGSTRPYCELREARS